MCQCLSFVTFHSLKGGRFIGSDLLATLQLHERSYSNNDDDAIARSPPSAPILEDLFGSTFSLFCVLFMTHGYYEGKKTTAMLGREKDEKKIVKIRGTRDGELQMTMQQHERRCCSEYADPRLYDVPPSTDLNESVCENTGGK